MIYFDTFYKQFRVYRTNLSTRTFSNQSVARKNIGIIDNILIHLLKLEYRFNYEYDHDKHIRDIAGWCMNVSIDMRKDKADDSDEVMHYYVLASNPEKKLPKWTKFFRDNYGFKGQLTQDDLFIVANHAVCLISMSTKPDMIAQLNYWYPL